MNKDSASLSLFISNFDKKITKYNNVDASINLDTDYEDDEETKTLIRAKRSEINDYINNYNNNKTQLENAKTTLTELNTSLADYIEDLSAYKEILEDLEDFEDTFDPGYFDKNPRVAKGLELDANLLSVAANKLVLDDLTESDWYQKRHDEVEKLLADNDLEEAAFNATDEVITPLLGFKYDSNEDYYYTTDSSIQSKFGFWDELDHIGPVLGMDLNTEVVTFTSGTSEYRLQLWKGEYGFGNAYGAEVGLYSRPIQDAIENPYEEGKAGSLNIHYDVLPEEEQISIKNTVFDENGVKLLKNNTKNYEENHYWNLAIETTERTNAKDTMYTSTILTIEDDDFRENLYEALAEADIFSEVSISGNEVSFTWK